MSNEYSSHDEFLERVGVVGKKEVNKEEGPKQKYKEGDHFPVNNTPFGDLTDPYNPEAGEHLQAGKISIENGQATLTAAGATWLNEKFAGVRDSLRLQALKDTLERKGGGKDNRQGLGPEVTFNWRTQIEKELGHEIMAVLGKHGIILRVVRSEDGAKSYEFKLIQSGNKEILYECEFNRNNFQSVFESKIYPNVSTMTEGLEKHGEVPKKKGKK